MKDFVFYILIALFNVSLFWIGLTFDELTASDKNFIETIKNHLSLTTGIITICLIMIVYFLRNSSSHTQEKIDTQEKDKSDFKDTIQTLMYSPLPINDRLRKALDLTNKIESFNDWIVVKNEKNFLKIMLQSEGTKSFLLNETIELNSENFHHHPIERFILDSHLANNEFSVLKEVIEETNMSLISLQLKTSGAKNSLGQIIFISEKDVKESEKPHLLYLAQIASFCINISKKQEEITKNSLSNLEHFKGIEKSTGIYNSERMHFFLQHELNRYQRYKTEFCLVLMEIDNFDNICNIFSDEESEILL